VVISEKRSNKERITQATLVFPFKSEIPAGICLPWLIAASAVSTYVKIMSEALEGTNTGAF